MARSLQSLCNLAILQYELDYQRLPTTLIQTLDCLQQCDEKVYFPILQHDMIVYECGIRVQICAHKGDITLTLGQSDEYDANFSRKQSDFHIVVTNTGQRRALLELFYKSELSNKFLIPPQRRFVFDSVIENGIQFNFNRDLPVIYYMNDMNSNQLFFEWSLEDEIDHGDSCNNFEKSKKISMFPTVINLIYKPL